MDKISLVQVLADLPLGPVRYFERIESTNDEISRWSDEGAPDLSLIVANEQTAGRGRAGRHWLTPPDAALAFSLLLHTNDGNVVSPAVGRPSSPPFYSIDLNDPQPQVARDGAIATIAKHTALGALAVCEALESLYGLKPQIKWPNDVLLSGRKVCGILTEARWQGDWLSAVILGIGINLGSKAVPAGRDAIFPATCVEDELGRNVERENLLRSVLERIIFHRSRLDTPGFMQGWDARLAFKGEQIRVYLGTEINGTPDEQGVLLGIDQSGCLRLRTMEGEERILCTGEVHLRPVEGDAA